MLDPRRVGEALSGAAPDLARAWRAARASSRRGFFPGLLDGLVEPLFAAIGEGLAQGGHAALVWPQVAGVVRLHAPDPDATEAELDAEWALAEQVLLTACEALGAGEAPREWVTRAIGLGRTGTRALFRGGGPEGILVLWVHSAAAATPRARGRGRP
jgi:hypothetical protein